MVVNVTDINTNFVVRLRISKSPDKTVMFLMFGFDDEKSDSYFMSQSRTVF